MAVPNALILRAPGTNCDFEVEKAFEMVGGRGTRLHLNAVIEKPRLLRDYQILVLPGGFSYGDDVAAGKVQAIYMQHFLADALRKFRDDISNLREPVEVSRRDQSGIIQVLGFWTPYNAHLPDRAVPPPLLDLQLSEDADPATLRIIGSPEQAAAAVRPDPIRAVPKPSQRRRR